MSKRFIDATNQRLGRLATAVAKYALAGDEIHIVNSEHAVIVGNKKDIFKKYLKRGQVGSRYNGPFFPKKSDQILKRAIRGMLPYKEKRGREALSRVKAYISVPDALKNEKFERIPEAELGQIERKNYIELSLLSNRLGGY